MNFDAFNKAFGENVRRARWAARLTLEDLAAKALTYRLLSAIENGRGNPTLETVFILARALNVHPSELLMTREMKYSGYMMLSERKIEPIALGRKRVRKLTKNE